MTIPVCGKTDCILKQASDKSCFPGEYITSALRFKHL